MVLVKGISSVEGVLSLMVVIKYMSSPDGLYLRGYCHLKVITKRIILLDGIH